VLALHTIKKGKEVLLHCSKRLSGLYKHSQCAKARQCQSTCVDTANGVQSQVTVEVSYDGVEGRQPDPTK